MVGARRDVAADMHRDLRLGHRLRPTGERNPTAWRDARAVRKKADERAADLEALEDRGGAEADLPAERLVASVETLAPQRKLRGHAAHDARIVAEVHVSLSVVPGDRALSAFTRVFNALWRGRPGTHTYRRWLWVPARARSARLAGTTALTSAARRVDLVARILDRAGAHPAPGPHHVLARRVVEAMPAAARRVDHVAFDRRLLAEVAVDVAAALDHDEELVAVVMPVPLVTRARLEHGPADDVIGARRFLVDQELHLHVDPAVLARQALDLRHVADVGAVHRRAGAGGGRRLVVGDVGGNPFGGVDGLLQRLAEREAKFLDVRCHDCPPRKCRVGKGAAAAPVVGAMTMTAPCPRDCKTRRECVGTVLCRAGGASRARVPHLCPPYVSRCHDCPPRRR